MSNYYCGYAIPITHFQGFLDEQDKVEGAIRTAINYNYFSESMHFSTLYDDEHKPSEKDYRGNKRRHSTVKTCGKITKNIDAETKKLETAGTFISPKKINGELAISKELGIDLDTKWVEFEGHQDNCDVRVKSYAILPHEVIACLYYKS